jgi:hypothetical protein
MGTVTPAPSFPKEPGRQPWSRPRSSRRRWIPSHRGSGWTCGHSQGASASLDQLLWWRARGLLADQVRASAHLSGTARLSAVIAGVLRAIGTDRPLRVFLEADPETAMRILTGTRSTVHQGMVGALENLIDLERGRGTFDASLDTPTLSYAIVRVSEGFLYADVIADRAPDIGRAVTLIEALLRGLDLVHRTPAPVAAGTGS